MVGALAENLYNELNTLNMIDILTFEALTKGHNYLNKIGDSNIDSPSLHLIDKDLCGPDLQSLINSTPIIKIRHKTIHGVNIRAKNKDLESNMQIQEIREDI